MSGLLIILQHRTHSYFNSYYESQDIIAQCVTSGKRDNYTLILKNNTKRRFIETLNFLARN